MLLLRETATRRRARSARPDAQLMPATGPSSFRLFLVFLFGDDAVCLLVGVVDVVELV